MEVKYDVLIIGGGAGGISAAASILKRRKGLDIGIVEPCTEHYYQPGWTLVMWISCIRKYTDGMCRLIRMKSEECFVDCLS